MRIVKIHSGERKEQIAQWVGYVVDNMVESEMITQLSRELIDLKIRNIDALHLDCAVNASVGYFLTTDDGILKKIGTIQGLKVTDPIGFVKEALP